MTNIEISLLFITLALFIINFALFWQTIRINILYKISYECDKDLIKWMKLQEEINLMTVIFLRKKK